MKHVSLYYFIFTFFFISQSLLAKKDPSQYLTGTVELSPSLIKIKLPKTYKTVEEADQAINKWKSANPVWVNQKTNQLTPSSIVAYGGTSLNTDIVKGKQQQMADAGFDIAVDGVWGPNSRAAWTEFSDPNRKKKQPVVSQQVIDPSTGEVINQGGTGTGPTAGQTGRSKKDDIQVDAIEKLPVKKMDVKDREMELETVQFEVNIDRKEKENEIVDQKEEEYTTKLPTDGLKEVTIKGSSNIFNYEAKEEDDFNFGNEDEDDNEDKSNANGQPQQPPWRCAHQQGTSPRENQYGEEPGELKVVLDDQMAVPLVHDPQESQSEDTKNPYKTEGCTASGRLCVGGGGSGFHW